VPPLTFAQEARTFRALMRHLGLERVHVVQRQKLLLEWLPNVEPFVRQGAGHLLHLQNAGGMAAGLAAFFERHSFGVAA
jgi:hypothetical protein